MSGLVRSGKVPDDGLRSHMFGCSECFQEHHNALVAYRADTKEAAAAESDSWWNKFFAGLFRRPVPLFAGALSLVLLAFVGTYVWREYRAARKQTVVKQEAPPADGAAKNQPAASLLVRNRNSNDIPPERSGAPPSPERSVIAIYVDLEKYSVTRGVEGGGSEIKLSRRRTRLLLKLPEGSAKDSYTVSIVGANGNTLDRDYPRSPDGETLIATLDIQNLAPQKYSLRIARQIGEGEPPISVPIVVTAETISPAKEN